MVHIIIEGIDFAGKTYIANCLRIFGYKKYVMKEIAGSFDIDDHISTFSNLYNVVSDEKSVFDRFFISLIVYYLNIGIDFDSNYLRSLITKFLLKMNGSKIIFLINNYKVTKRRILFRKNILRKDISQHDIKIINSKQYFDNYYDIFINIFELIDDIIKSENLDIKIYRFDTSYLLLGLH